VNGSHCRGWTQGAGIDSEITKTLATGRRCLFVNPGLALQTDELPGSQARGGILTPATGLGDVLAERLCRTGMTVAMNP